MPIWLVVAAVSGLVTLVMVARMVWPAGMVCPMVQVAELVPPRGNRSPLLADALLAEAVREGWITPPALAHAELPPRQPVMTFKELMDELRRDREDR